MTSMIDTIKNALGFLTSPLKSSESGNDHPSSTVGSKRIRSVAHTSSQYGAGRQDKKRKTTSDHSDNAINKRTRITEHTVDEEAPSDLTSESDLDSSSAILSHTGSAEWNFQASRGLMPPPSLTVKKARPGSRVQQPPNDAGDTSSDMSFATRSTKQRLHHVGINEYDMEKARRHAAATTLPPNSGIWERGEKELFYHLSYRGFEPLIPKNWMKDFPTLPLSLYANQDDQVPLIRNGKTREFRAIRELRDLMEVGKNVRDRVLASPGSRSEVIIEKACKKYVSWALADAGIMLAPRSRHLASPIKGMLPVYVIVSLKPGQTTHDCLLELKFRLHDLAACHRKARNIQASVERDRNLLTPEDEETFIIETQDDDLPVLYGLMICSSILAVLTMNSHTSPMKGFSEQDKLISPYLAQRQTCLERSPEQSSSSQTNWESIQPITKSSWTRSRKDKVGDGDADDPASDPRFISNFDFSDPSRDVWNALVIAIVAMQIRSDSLRLHRASDVNHEREDESILSGMDLDEDDPSFLGRVCGAAKKHMLQNLEAKEEEDRTDDDPDL